VVIRRAYRDYERVVARFVVVGRYRGVVLPRTHLEWINPSIVQLAEARAELERMVDPAHYLGLAGEMIDRVLALEAQATRL
jgi:DNA-binding transcriptional regulator YhcF (GntR family)